MTGTNDATHGRQHGDQNHTPEEASRLVARAKGGDQRAFGELVRRYRPRIFALCLHLTGNESDADDTTQEVFLRAYDKLDQFAGRSEFFTWVYRMAVNRSLNARRDRARRARRQVLGDPRIDKAVAVDAAGDPIKAAELRQTYERLLEALDKLPAAMRATVVLVALQGLSHAEAAVVQKCSPGTIAWRMHAARDKLRESLEGPKRIEAPRAHKGLSHELLGLLRLWGLPAVSSA
ncbi:MAG: sigma-70 family RNA polymerase sigma factor [Myxococcales bacterium]|nr:sigma-70 family RNA polymerase sigma factor [Myxococcales bacterium]